ncbi:MAG: hypothetical protein ACE5HI_15215 [bacterium]
MEQGKIPEFRAFCESKFHLTHWASCVKDKRQNVEIPASTVYNSVFLMGALGLGSLLACDQTLRTPIGQRWFAQKEPAVSDTTMARSLETMKLLRPILYSAYRLGRRQGLSKCHLRSGKLRIGLLDGSMFGKFEASCFQVVGPASLMVDLEHIPKRGKELPSSYALLRRLKNQFHDGFVDIICGDGLYLNAPFVNLCLHEVFCDVLVKTDDTSLVIIADAINLFKAEFLSDKIQRASGVDEHRMCEYQVSMTDGFEMSGIDTKLSVAQVVEIDLRTGQREEFFVVASSKYLTKPLSAEEMRELAHWRWDIENNGFKELNQTVHTKHIYSHDNTAQEAVLLILFIVFNLLGLYLHKHIAELTDFPGIKLTRKFAIFLLRCIIIAAAFLEYG